jgi:hypothetical protein
LDQFSSAISTNCYHCLVRLDPAITLRVKAIEAQARGSGWDSQELWDAPGGLAAELEPDDQILEVETEDITIVKSKFDLKRIFRRQ